MFPYYSSFISFRILFYSVVPSYLVSTLFRVSFCSRFHLIQCSILPGFHFILSFILSSHPGFHFIPDSKLFWVPFHSRFHFILGFIFSRFHFILGSISLGEGGGGSFYSRFHSTWFLFYSGFHFIQKCQRIKKPYLDIPLWSAYHSFILSSHISAVI